jgi:glycosyltransferase involved in cell wall biosynthesis
MNYFGSALPVVARVGESSEVASLVHSTRSGWVFPPDGADCFGDRLAQTLRDPGALASASEAAEAAAREHFASAATAAKLAALVEGAIHR